MFRLGLLRNRLKERFKKPLEPDSEEAKSEAALLAAAAFGIATVLTLSTAGMAALVVGKACGVSNVSFLSNSPQLTGKVVRIWKMVRAGNPQTRSLGTQGSLRRRW